MRTHEVQSRAMQSESTTVLYDRNPSLRRCGSASASLGQFYLHVSVCQPVLLSLPVSLSTPASVHPLCCLLSAFPCLSLPPSLTHKHTCDSDSKLVMCVTRISRVCSAAPDCDSNRANLRFSAVPILGVLFEGLLREESGRDLSDGEPPVTADLPDLLCAVIFCKYHRCTSVR